MNPLDLDGPTFLQLYIVVLAGCTFAALLVRAAMRPAAAPLDPRGSALHPAEVAYLAGGDRQAVQATIAGLAQRDLIACDEKKRTIWAKAPALTSVDSFDRRLHGLLGAQPHSFEAVNTMARPVLASIRSNLEQLGLLESGDVRARVGMASAVVMLASVVLGIAKISVGVSRGRPVAFLVLLTAVAAIAAFVFLMNAPRRSRTGDEMLRALRKRYAALEATARSRAESVTADDLALTVGLFGVAVLDRTPHSSLARTMGPAPSSSDGSSGSSCSGGSGCGGGGGGCGGCGG